MLNSARDGRLSQGWRRRGPFVDSFSWQPGQIVSSCGLSGVGKFTAFLCLFKDS